MSIYIGFGTDKGDIFAISYDCSTSQFTDHFISKAHTKPVTSIIADENILISADNIGTMHSYCINSKRTLCTFDNSHTSSITSLSLSSDRKYLFTCDDNGLIIIWKKSNLSWEQLKIIDKHKKSVVMAIHPTDILGLSISKDNTFRVWDLNSFKQSHKMPIRQPFINVKISPNGKYYLLHTFNLINIYNFDEAKLMFTVKMEGNIKDILFIDDFTLCVGELKKIRFYTLSDVAREMNSIDMELNHVKKLSLAENNDFKYLICLGAFNSKMSIRIYNVTSTEDLKNGVLNTYEFSNVRVTSITSFYK